MKIEPLVMKSTHLKSYRYANINSIFSLQAKSQAQVFKDFESASISNDRSVFPDLDSVTQLVCPVLLFFQCGMTVETKGWGLDNKNFSLSI